MQITQQGDSTYDSFVISGVPGVEQVEVYALAPDDEAEAVAARLAAQELARNIRDMLAERQYVYIVTLPSDEHEERHVFTDHAHARLVADAIEGAQVDEQVIVGESFARTLIEQERDGE